MTLVELFLSIANAIREKKGTTEKIKAENFAEEIKTIEGGGKETEFTGHYDVEGLKAIGWTDEDIQYYQDNGVIWNEEDDDLFKLDEEEREGQQNISITRFLPKNKSVSSFQNNSCLMALPKIDTSSLTSFGNMFSACKSLITIPELNTSRVTNLSYTFSSCYSLRTIPLIDTGNVSIMTNAFTYCYSLKAIPRLNTSNVTNMESTFSNCSSLETIPNFNTSNVKSMKSIFSSCYSLRTIPLIDTSNVTNMESAFLSCFSLKTIPLINTSNVTNMTTAFQYCQSLTTIPKLDTGNVNSVSSMFRFCYSLMKIPELDFKKVYTVSNIFADCTKLMYLGGFKDLGNNYSTTQSANYSNYALTLNSCTLLTHDSLMNVINNLYDIKTKGCNTQALKLGSTNLAKLTAEEIAVATAKGWTVS